MSEGRLLYLAIRIFIVMAVGIVAAFATGNPLYLGLSVLGFAVLFFLVRREAVTEAPKWATALNTGKEQADKGDWPAAIASFQAAMAQCKGARPRRIACEDIGLLLLLAHRPGDAEPYLREAVLLTTRAFGPMAPRTVALRDKLSDLYVNAGQSWQAAQLLGGALAAVPDDKAARSTTLSAAETASRYADALQRSGSAEQASAYNQKALETIAKADPRSPMFLKATLSAARYASATGDHHRAIELLLRALDHANSDSGARLIDDARSALVEQYTAVAKYTEAVDVMQLQVKARVGLDPQRSAAMRRQLADLMEKAGRPEEALKQRRLAQTLEGMVAAAGHGPSIDGEAAVDSRS